MPAEPVIQVSDVAKVFSGFRAVDGVSISLAAGERRALIGPNGAGKTTLFNLISGRFRPDAGEIRYLGQALNKLNATARCKLGLARTFQITSIYHQLTPLENVQVALFARNGRSLRLFERATSLDREEALAALADVGLEGTVLSSESRFLSYGDQKRLELAMTLVLQPKVLLLDEPTAGVDSGTRRKLIDLIKRLWAQRQFTLLFCEHDMDAVFSIADRITVMHQGRVLTEGAPEDVRADAQVKAIYLGSAHGGQP